MNSLTGSPGPTGEMKSRSSQHPLMQLMEQYRQSKAEGKNRTGKLKKDIVPKGFNKGRLALYEPEQMQLFQQLFGQVSPDSYLSKLAGGDQATFNQIEAPALKQFSELQGNIASRFSGMGGLGARNSSGFQNEMGQKSMDFAQQLQSQRQSLQQQAIKDLMGFSSDLLGQKPYEKVLAPKSQKQPGFLHQAGVAFAGGAGEGLGKAAGNWFGG